MERAKVELTLSKTLMYDFYYNYIKRKYPNQTLLFTDTNSVTYQIQIDNVYEDFYDDKDFFDFPRYKKENPFYNDENKKVIGNLKDELNDKIIEEFVFISFIENKERKNKEGKGS